MDEVISAMRRRRHVPYNEENDFEILSPDFLSDLWNQLTSALVILTSVISSIGLLVGGIGVMNIMLVSVTERTREIGIRKAIGARKIDIVMQFLIEAVSLTGLGGVLGIIISILVTMLVGALLPALPSVVPAWAVAAGFGVSVLIGLFFGVWPAFKAAQLDPVVALRYE